MSPQGLAANYSLLIQVNEANSLLSPYFLTSVYLHHSFITDILFRAHSFSVMKEK